MSSKKATGGTAAAKSRRVMSLDGEWVKQRMNRRFEWIKMDDDSDVCIWSSTMGDTLQIIDASKRMGELSELGPDESMAIRFQIALAVHDGEPPEGQRIFADNTIQLVDLLSPSEMNQILVTSARLNGLDAPSLERLKAFMTRNGEEPPQS